MARYELTMTGQFRRDLKLAKKRGLDMELLFDVLDMLVEGEPLPLQYREHMLTGNYKGFYECHIQPDWLLIYDRSEVLRIIALQRTGTHSDLF